VTDRTCAHCGTPLSVRTGPGRRPDYCGPTCKDAAARERQQLWRVVGQAAVAAVEQRTIKESR
jgi:hypothetical protein